ncbi:sodium-dependent lysophosphatidylcholine symporter 1-like [Conger conger]|uniref:sodium-dependent lysophosphatidylcholine symporter 1-like n=1 Tax=Conger conger TaxID=82655 RepID=UPI002A5AE310|nr:sodium-dependent lysophosphatidylcholine symporter 1-like [Conger conger]
MRQWARSHPRGTSVRSQAGGTGSGSAAGGGRSEAQAPSRTMPKAAGIPLVTKLCYAVGGMPHQMTSIALGFSLQVFLLDVVQLDALYASLVLFLVRVWDAVTDPLVGYLVSRSSRTSIGKLLPWMLFSMPLAVFSYIMLWLTLQGSKSPLLNFFWHLSMSCLFEAFMSCYHVPYTSLNMFLGGNQKERDSATAYRMGAEVFAMLVGAVIQGQVVRVYSAEKDQTCRPHDHHPQNGHVSVGLWETRKAFLISAVVLGALHFLCCLLLFLGVREQMAPSSSTAPVGILSGAKMLFRHTPYLRLVIGFLFTSLAFQMSLGNLALFFTLDPELGGYFQYYILTLLVTATISVPVWQMLLVRIGKKTTMFIGMMVYVPPLVLIPSVPSNLPVYMAMSVLSGSSLATLFLLPWSMLPDVVDDFKAKNPGCTDLEPMFFSCYVLCNKFGAGMSVGVSTLALHFAGYKPALCGPSPDVVTTQRVLLGPAPLCLLLVGLVFFYRYPIDEARRQQVAAELEAAA